MPRHPPCALHSLSHTPPTQPTPTNQQKDPTRPPKKRATSEASRKSLTEDESDVAVHTTHYKDARVHYPDLKQQPHTHHQPRTTRDQGSAGLLEPSHSPHHPPGITPGDGFGSDSSEPQQCAPTHPAPAPGRRPGRQEPADHAPDQVQAYGWGNVDDSTSEHHHCANTTAPISGQPQQTLGHGCRSGRVLLRKEVIQPHLPVRLPCYDFVPIASPTFDHSPHTRWLGHGLRVLPTFVT